jgi:hypothetical protein
MLLVMFGIMGVMANGQGTFFSTLSGTVVDATGAVIPGADVKIRHNGTGSEFTTLSGEGGTFTIPSIPGGTYTVTVALPGFKTAVLSSVTVNAAAPSSVRVVLEVGGREEEIKVEAESSTVVQTQTSAIATTMTATQIISLPLSSRNALDSVTSLPGFATSATARDSTISGLPQGAINITLDGMSIQDNYNKTTDGYFAA